MMSMKFKLMRRPLWPLASCAIDTQLLLWFAQFSMMWCLSVGCNLVWCDVNWYEGIHVNMMWFAIVVFKIDYGCLRTLSVIHWPFKISWSPEICDVLSLQYDALLYWMGCEAILHKATGVVTRRKGVHNMTNACIIAVSLNCIHSDDAQVLTFFIQWNIVTHICAPSNCIGSANQTTVFSIM